MKTLARVIATGLGTGNLPLAPGTWGALAGVSVLYLLRQLPQFSSGLEIGLLLLICIVGTWATHQVLPQWGKDPSRVVIDEWAGVCLGLLLVPFSWMNFALGFLLFRFFDIAKPLGIKQAENLPGAYGVMADDLLAGLYTLLIMQGLQLVI